MSLTRSELQMELTRRLCFEELLADISAIFINLPVEQIDGAIEHIQRRICEALGFDLSSLWQWEGESGRFMTLTHILARFERSIHPDDLDLVRQAISDSFEKGKVVDIEYRVLVKPTVQKWISSKEQPQFNVQGEPIRLLGISVDISRHKHLESELKQRLEEVESLKQQLENENTYLREDIRGGGQGFEKVIGDSQSLQSVLVKVRQVAGTDSTVLIQGETGVGKELIAQAIHQLSERKNRLMVTVNCAALPAALIESELFGREKGAFTGALSRQPGRFELANKSTLFLDEIAEMPLETQAKLLRVLQDGKFERLGSSTTISFDVRILTATNRDLAKEVEEGRFRRDLYFRLNVFPINVPPLRNRVEDIPMLVWKFVNEFSKLMGKKISRINSRDMDKLKAYPWPGNVRELRNIVERAMIVSNGNFLDLSHLELVPPPAARPLVMSLEDMERQHIKGVISVANGKIKGKEGAAELLGLNPSTLYSRMRKLGVKCNPSNQRNDISTSNG